MQPEQSEDPRWRRFSELASCGLAHAGLFDLACDRLDFWQGSTEKSPNSGVLGADNVLSDDFCIIDGQHDFVRSVLELPLVGCPARCSALAFGPRFSASIAWNLQMVTPYAGSLDHLYGAGKQRGCERPSAFVVFRLPGPVFWSVVDAWPAPHFAGTGRCLTCDRLPS